MNSNKNILLTFDYELFLGNKSGTVDNCLIKPTDLILEILRKNNAKAIFFIDTTYLKRLTEVAEFSSGAQKDLKNIENQLLKICKDGHYLFHHIHPHWIDAVYQEDENQWLLENTSKFTINLISESERESLFSDSFEYLFKIIKKVNNANKPEGFRAGGLYIEPFEAFKKYFEKFDIKYEFSVVPNLKKQDEFLFYDFTRCPADPYYNFENEASIKVNNGKFKEFTISQFKLMGVTKILNGLYYRMFKLKQKHYGDGQSIGYHFNSSEKDKSISRFFISENILSLELMNPVITLFYKKLFKKNTYLHFISHPKLLSDLNLDQFDILLKLMTDKYNIEYDFKKF